MSYRSVSDQLIISVLHVDNYEQELKRAGTADNYVAIEGEPEGLSTSTDDTHSPRHPANTVVEGIISTLAYNMILGWNLGVNQHTANRTSHRKVRTLYMIKHWLLET